MEEVESLSSFAEEVVLLTTERVVYCPPVMWNEAVRVNGPLQKNVNAITSSLKAVGRNHKERQITAKSTQAETKRQRNKSLASKMNICAINMGSHEFRSIQDAYN